MAQIKCPHCGKAFTVDESEYASIVKQVRDAEFERDIEERVRLVEKNQGSAVAAAELTTPNCVLTCSATCGA